MFKEEFIYGLNKLIREHTGFPQWIELPCEYEHGISVYYYPLKSKYRNKKPVILAYNKMSEKVWKKHSRKPIFILGSPFVHFRRDKQIEMKQDAQGTVAFPSHSTDLIDAEFDINEYCNELLNLPPEFHPVTICLHWDDILKGKNKVFETYGFAVKSAGDIYSPEFCRNFYDILSSHKYSTSNQVGSYTFYAVEMGIPFFIIGKLPVLINHGGDPNVPENEYCILEEEHSKYVHELFNTGPVKSILEEQKKLTDQTVGVNDCMEGRELGKILLKFYFASLPRRLKRFLISLPAESLSILKKLKLFSFLVKNNLLKENKIYTHMEVEEKIALYNLVSQINKNNPNVVEIGSYIGASSCFIAKALQKQKGKLYCIDTWENQTMPDGEKDTYSLFMSNTSRYKDVIVPIRGYSSEVSGEFTKYNKKVELLFIDGDHSYEGCLTDWDLYSPYLSEDAIIVFHDTSWAQGVNRVIKENVAGVADKVLSLPNMQAFRLKTKVNKKQTALH